MGWRVQYYGLCYMDILHASHNVTGTTQLPGDNLRGLLHLTPTMCSLWTDFFGGVTVVRQKDSFHTIR